VGGEECGNSMGLIFENVNSGMVFGIVENFDFFFVELNFRGFGNF